MNIATKFREFVIEVLKSMCVYKRRNPSYTQIIKSEIETQIDHNSVTLLDVGAGTGKITEPLAGELGISVIALDISTERLHDAKMEGVHPIVGDGQNLPFATESIDFCTCISVLEHLIRPEDCVREMARVTRKRGKIIIQLPNLQYIFEIHTKWPLLYLMPKRVIESIKASTGYRDLNLSVTKNRVLKWFQRYNCTLRKEKSWFHGMGLAKILRMPLGWLLIFQKT